MSAVAMAEPRAEVRASSVFFALLRRDVRVARRELPFFLLRTTMQPLMFVIVFGYLLPRMGFMGEGYTTALLPGVLAISLTFSSIQSVALPMVQEFGWTKEIEDRLLAPVPIWLVAVASDGQTIWQRERGQVLAQRVVLVGVGGELRDLADRKSVV